MVLASKVSGMSAPSLSQMDIVMVVADVSIPRFITSPCQDGCDVLRR